MERSERPATGNKSGERPNWRNREKNDSGGRADSTIEKAATSAGRPQTRIERPVSRRGLQSSTRESSSQNSLGARATTPARNAIARPPSASGYSQRAMTGSSSRLGTSNPLARVNTGLPSSVQMNMNLLDRPISQQGIAGVRPGTTRGLAINRQIQDKRYYEGLVQLKIRELSQEITRMSREIEAQKKERATFLHYDNRAKELASELTELQGRLADYNIVIDKATSNVDREAIEEETRLMALENDRTSVEMENLFEQKRSKEQKLGEVTERVESEQKNATRIIETMEREDRERYDRLREEKVQLEREIGKMQREMDFLSSEKRSLEEKMALSQIKQEAAKLRVKLVEIEAKRDKLQEEKRNKLSPEEERERLLARVKQDNMEIAAAERRISDVERRINDVEQELEQLEVDLDDGQTEKQTRYKELKKREEAMEQFMPSFDQNKKEETEKLESLEEKVVERLRELSYAVDEDARITPSEEMALLKIPASQVSSDESGVDQSFEGLTREHARLRQALEKMGILEKRLDSELDELKEKIAGRRNELVVLEDLDGLKARSEIKYEQLMSDRDHLKKRQSICKRELEAARSEHDEMKKRLDKNETYVQISALEARLERLREANVNVDNFIVEGKNRVNYEPLKVRAFDLLDRYNSVLKENVKSNH